MIEDAARLVQSHRRTGILLDANLLVLLLVGQVDRKLITKCTVTNAYEEIDFALLAGLLGDDAALIVTPHVAAEASNLGNALSGRARDAYRRYLAQYLAVARERWKEATRIVGEAEYTRLGLTDAGLLGLKRRAPLILTDDLGLYLALAQRGRPAIKFAHLMEEVRSA